jgi:hypothetical protein
MKTTLTDETRVMVFGIEDVPDLPIRHTTMTIVPDTVTLTYKSGRRTSVSTEGWLRLKSGEISTRKRNSTGWSLPDGHASEDAPDWAVAMVAEHQPRWGQ